MATRSNGNILVGDEVRFTIGTTPVYATVVEDRGPLGAGGIRLYRVRLPHDPYEAELFELPEDDLERVAAGSLKGGPIDAADTMAYLKGGGLAQILLAGASGGEPTPRVWLRRDSQGNVVHTFSEERGSLGGATVPLLALQGSRVFEPKREEVVQFLKSFGLSAKQAVEALRAVGEAP